MRSTTHLRSLAAIAAIAVLGLSSCSNKATEEQMKTLADLDRQRDGLQQDLQRAESNLRDANTKLANANRDLQNCTSDTQAATAGLARWPNIWADSADWRLAPPPPPPAPEKPMKSHRKH